jgi:glycosyltransferase involved in cell wall biosynthesis
MMCRVVHVTSTHGAMDTRIFWRECRSLSRAGFEVCIVAHDIPSECFDGVRFVELPEQFTRLSILAQPYRTAAFLAKLEGDIYHFHDPDLLPVAGLMSRRDKVTIYDCHEWYHEVFPHKGYPHMVTKTIQFAYNLVEKHVVPSLSAVVTPTEELAAVYQGKAKMTVPIVNFAPLDLHEGDYTGNIRQEHDLIHVGTLSRPRLSFMLDIIRELHHRGREATLLLLGISDELQTWIESQSDVADFVTGMARIPGDQVPKVLRTARIGLNYHPYQPRFMVAIPMKVFEYMRYGLPFVSSALPPLKKILGDTDTGVLVESNDVTAFADAISTLMDDEQALATMGKHGQECVRCMYNWETESVKLIELYNMLVSEYM